MAQTTQDIQALLEQQYQKNQEDQRSFSDKLKERRAGMQQFADFGAERLNQSTTPDGIPMSPGTLFDTRQGFRQSLSNAIEPLQQQYIQSQAMGNDLLSQIASLAQNREQFDFNKGITEREMRLKETPTPSISSPKDVSDLLNTRDKLKEQGFDTSSIDTQIEAMGIGKTGDGGKQLDLISQINNLGTAGERNGARAVKDILDVVDSAIKKAEGTPTGPISAGVAQVSKLMTPNKTAQLQKDLKEILRTVRKESTGVAFSPQEIQELENEIPTIMQQEGNVKDSLIRLKQRMLQKLTNYGLDVAIDTKNSDINDGYSQLEDGFSYKEIK